MPNYNFLPNNKSEFPHIDNVNTYQYDNEFDYGRFDYTQMELQICTVPWDMGEAHIGNRTISGIGNVVYFETKAKRDKWFDDIPDTDCYRFETKFKELHRDHVIDVPIPYDMCAKHNYLVVRYAKFANENSPVMYEGDDGLREWFWFIREVEFVAPNTTRLHLLDDAFQTWIYDVDVSGMILERGHAPMFSVSADTYLANPIGNNEYLLTEDVNYGEASQVTNIDAVTLNAGTMYACIASTANPTSANWTHKTPASHHYVNNGVPSVYVFAMQVGNLSTFLANVDSQCPQFKQTIQGVFFASNALVTVVNPFTFCGVSCYGVMSERKTIDLTTLSKSLFGYDSKYADIAKLYTSPYAHLEITDETGDVTVIKIEDTSGNIDVSAFFSLAFPFINIDTYLTGVGGSASKSITFKNLDSKTVNLSGIWYETLRSWQVPTFAVVLDAAKEYDYSTYYDRAQRVVDYTAVKNNEYAIADADKANADAIADTGKANADATADNLVTNAGNDAANLVANTKIARDTATHITTSIHNPTIDSINVANNDKIIADANIASSVTLAQTSASNDFAAVSNGYSQAANLGTSLVGALGSITSASNPDGASIIGGLVGIAKSEIGAIAANSITTQAILKDATIAQSIAAANSAYASNATTLNNLVNGNAGAGVSGYVQIENAATTQAQNESARDQMANNASTINANAANTSAKDKANALLTQTTEKANALRTQTTEKANADRTANAAQSAIDNDVAQAGLRAPFTFGEFASGDTATSRPMALFSHVVTQSKSAISAAGDYMLRYGYAFDKYWEFDGNWNIGKYFTYWKLRDFWVSNLNVPDMYMDKLRFFLFGGVTVWKDPDYIGKVSIYENYEG